MRKLSILPILALPALLLAACSDSSTTPASPSAQATLTSQAASETTRAPATTATVSTASPQPNAATTAAGGTVKKVSANNATQAELAAAFQAANISGAAQWAREVVEYRPYSADDPNMAKLRQNLAKYNPGPGVVDQLVAAMSLP